MRKIRFIKEYKVPGFTTFKIGTIREMMIEDSYAVFYLGCCGNRKEYKIPNFYFEFV